jgi:hypothetical protein
MTQVPGPSPPEPAAATSGVRETTALIGGIVAGILVCLGVPLLGIKVGTALSLTPAVTTSFCLLGGVLLWIREPTRVWGRGLLIGLLGSLVIALVIAAVLLATLPR